jgi:Putative beta-barrel porin-2, OmpL-like. bbp2
VVVTPVKDFAVTFNTIIGPEQLSNKSNLRYLFNLILAYTGIKKLTLALDSIYGTEENEAFIASLDTRRDTDAAWWGSAGYVAYDWTEKLRTAARAEYFRDADGARTGLGSAVSLWGATGTLQYKIWKGLVGRLEYRHDQAQKKAFKVHGGEPTGKSQDTITLAFYYLFF